MTFKSYAIITKDLPGIEFEGFGTVSPNTARFRLAGWFDEEKNLRDICEQTKYL